MEQLLKQFVQFVAEVIGPSAEIALHDVVKQEIIALENGVITGRQVGAKDDAALVRIMEKLAEHNKDFVCGYRGTSSNSLPLRSSNMFIRDDSGELRYVLCVNQNIAEIERFQSFLSFFTDIREPFSKQQNHTEVNPEDSIDLLTNNLIFSEIERMKHTGIDINSRDARLNILKQLDEKGVFDVRKAVPKVCELLSISQATLYNYLKEIRAS